MLKKFKKWLIESNNSSEYCESLTEYNDSIRYIDESLKDLKEASWEGIETWSHEKKCYVKMYKNYEEFEKDIMNNIKDYQEDIKRDLASLQNIICQYNLEMKKNLKIKKILSE